jgi:hypothetical protein
VFLNLSNHPAAMWSPAQRAAAEALGGGIVDEPFPDVPAKAGPREVSAIGAALAERLLPLSPAAAMIQGEFTLAFYLVGEFESRGIACYAATTRRVVELAAQPDGTVEKKTRFEFVRFRRYVRPPWIESPCPSPQSS